MQKKKPGNFICTYFAVMIGVLIGCIFFLYNITSQTSSLFDYGLDDYNVVNLQNLSTNRMIFHILQKRIITILIFLSLAFLISYPFSSAIFCGGFGIYYGLLVSNLIVKFGVAGLMYGFVCFFPHYFLYFFMIYLGGKWRMIQNSATIQSNKQKDNLEHLIKLSVIIVLCFLSLSWEIFFEKIFLNYFFQYLV